MVYLVVVHRKYDETSYAGFKELKDANVYMDEMSGNSQVDFVEGPICVVER